MAKDLVRVTYQDDIVIKSFDSTSHIDKPLKEIVNDSRNILFFGITSAKSPNILDGSEATLVQLGCYSCPHD